MSKKIPLTIALTASMSFGVALAEQTSDLNTSNTQSTATSQVTHADESKCASGGCCSNGSCASQESNDASK